MKNIFQSGDCADKGNHHGNGMGDGFCRGKQDG